MSTPLDIHKSKNVLRNFFKKDGFAYSVGNMYKYLTGSSNLIPKLKIDKKFIISLVVLAVAGFGLFGIAGSAQAVREFKS